MRRHVPLALALAIGFTLGHLAQPRRTRPAAAAPVAVEILVPQPDGGWRKHRFAVTSVATDGDTIDLRRPTDGVRGWYVRLSADAGPAVAVHCEPEPD